jgi:hypothetical protein
MLIELNVEEHAAEEVAVALRRYRSELRDMLLRAQRLGESNQDTLLTAITDLDDALAQLTAQGVR